MDKIREGMGGRRPSSAAKAGEAGEDRLGFHEVNVRDLAAVAAMPTERGPLKPGRFRVEEQEEKL